MIVGFMDDMESGMRSGDKTVAELGTLIADIVRNKDVHFTKEELKTMLDKLDQLHALCNDNKKMKLSPQDIKTAIEPCENLLIARLDSLPKMKQ